MWWTMDDDYNLWFENQKDLNEGNFNAGSRPRSQKNRRSSSGKGRHPKSQLSLEKKFCLVVGGVSWKKLLDTQKYMHQDEKVMQWKDSAVEEAYWNAKKRFLAKVLGQPCDTNLPDPDPDVFIDEIDWDSNVDSSLMLDLDNRDPDNPGETDQKYSGVVVGIPVVPEQYINMPSGWGDDEQFKIPERCDNDWQEYDNWDEKGVNNADIGWSNEQSELQEKYNSNWHEYNNWVENGVNNADIGWSNGWENGFFYATYQYHEENRLGKGGPTGNKQGDHGYNKKPSYGGRNTARCKKFKDQSSIDDYGNKKRGNFSNNERAAVVKWRPVSRQR